MAKRFGKTKREKALDSQVEAWDRLPLKLQIMTARQLYERVLWLPPGSMSLYVR